MIFVGIGLIVNRRIKGLYINICIAFLCTAMKARMIEMLENTDNGEILIRRKMKVNKRGAVAIPSEVRDLWGEVVGREVVFTIKKVDSTTYVTVELVPQSV